MRTRWRLLALSSLVLLVAVATAETRPRYGGSLRVEMRAELRSLDPIEAQSDAFANIAPLLYDTLTRLDSSGHVVPSIAATWQQESDRRWRVTLRPDARFSDGSPVTPALVAQCLHQANPDWNARAIGESLIVESDQSLTNFAAELALPRNSIVLRADSKLLGTGPFRVSEFQPSRKLVVTAQEDGWHSRPYLDSVEIQFGRGTRDQFVDLELGRVDLVEVAPEQLARVVQAGRRVALSDPVELLALRFSRSIRDPRVREALARSVDRDAIVNVVMQRQGEVAGGFLPNWLTGYAFLFPTAPQRDVARQVKATFKSQVALILVYAADDPSERLVAQRIALNAADAGVTLKILPSVPGSTVPDIELVHMRLTSTDPAVALHELGRPPALGLAIAPMSASPAEVYRASASALQEYWAVPIAYMPVAYALGGRVRSWTQSRDGAWSLDDVWLAPEAGRP